jgi:hypothetical protein
MRSKKVTQMAAGFTDEEPAARLSIDRSRKPLRPQVRWLDRIAGESEATT